MARSSRGTLFRHVGGKAIIPGILGRFIPNNRHSSACLWTLTDSESSLVKEREIRWPKSEGSVSESSELNPFAPVRNRPFFRT